MMIVILLFMTGGLIVRALCLAAVLLAFACIPLPCISPANAASEALRPIQITYYAKNSATGVMEQKIRWDIRNKMQWHNFQNNIKKSPAFAAASPLPIEMGPAEYIVFSDRDANGLSGRDIFVTPFGITITQVLLQNKYYQDTNKMYNFLDEQRKLHTGFDTVSSMPISKSGIVVQHFIYNAMANPVWHVSNPQDMSVYEGFLRGSKPYEKFVEMQITRSDAENQEIISEFESNGSFMVYMNYPSSPATAVSVTKNGHLRVSTIDTRVESYTDPNTAIFSFYKEQALQRIKQRDDAIKAREKIRQSQQTQ